MWSLSMLPVHCLSNQSFYVHVLESLSNQSFYVHVQTCGWEWVSESEAWSVAKVSYIDLIDPDNWEETIATSIASISSGQDT